MWAGDSQVGHKDRKQLQSADCSARQSPAEEQGFVKICLSAGTRREQQKSGTNLGPEGGLLSYPHCTTFICPSGWPHSSSSYLMAAWFSLNRT